MNLIKKVASRWLTARSLADTSTKDLLQMVVAKFKRSGFKPSFYYAGTGSYRASGHGVVGEYKGSFVSFEVEDPRTNGFSLESYLMDQSFLKQRGTSINGDDIHWKSFNRDLDRAFRNFESRLKDIKVEKSEPFWPSLFPKPNDS